MHWSFVGLAVVGLLSGCFQLVPSKTAGDAPTADAPLFASLSEEDQKRLMRERIEAYLRRQCLPDIRLDQVTYTKVNTWAEHPAMAAVGRFPGMASRATSTRPGLKEPAGVPGPWWIATAQGRWYQAAVETGEMSAVFEGNAATFAFSTLSGQTHVAWMVPNDTPPKMAPTATLRVPAFHDPTFDRDDARRPH